MFLFLMAKLAIIRKAVKAKAKKLQKIKTRTTCRIMRASRKVAHHDAENDVHLMSIAYIPEMIENAVFIEKNPNEKGSKV